jgi:hypothetical protein
VLIANRHAHQHGNNIFGLGSGYCTVQYILFGPFNSSCFCFGIKFINMEVLGFFFFFFFL